MTAHYALNAAKRERAGKGVARALRRDKQIPAVIYGDNKAPISISLVQNTINVEYNKGHMFTSLCDMVVDGEKYLVLARDIQVHPVNDMVIHADFLRVNEKTKIAVEVPVEFINEDKAPGLLDAGGILNVVRHEVELLCSAVNIPEYLQVDLAGKEIGDSIRISSAIMPAGTKPVIDRDFVIATIAAPKSVEQLEAELADTGAPETVEVESIKVASDAEVAAKAAAEGAKDKDKKK